MSTFQDEVKQLEESIQADNEWTELRSCHRTRLLDFLKLSEELVSNVDKMLKMWEKEFTINGPTNELAAMGQDIAKDAFTLGAAIKLLGAEADGFADRAMQIQRDVQAHIENIG